MKCLKCNGEKAGNDIWSFGDNYCDFCCGKEDLDWIENIFGVKRPVEFDIWNPPASLKNTDKIKLLTGLKRKGQQI
jgi:hypothetical protein